MNSKPISRNPQRKTEMMKAKIWLLVSELQKMPMLTKLALSKKRPM